MNRLTRDRLDDIRKKVLSTPGEETFEPAYMYRTVRENAMELLAEVNALNLDVEILLSATDIIDLAMKSDNAHELLEAVDKMRTTVKIIRG